MKKINKFTESLGLNVHPVVCGLSIIIILSVVLSTLLNLSQTAQIFEDVQSAIAGKAGWFYILTVNIILGFTVYLIFSKYGKNNNETIGCRSCF